MQINATNNLSPLPEPGRRVAAPQADRQDAAIFNTSAAISQKLAQAPDARPEAVARARELIANTSYPPDVTINGIANLLAAEFGADGE